MSLVESIAQSIAAVESGGNPNALSYRNNNPGNLRSWGSNPIVSGYAKFSTLQDGWNALYQQIQLNIGRGLTLNEFFAGKPGVYAGYAPSVDSNSPLAYAQRVGSDVGIPVDVPLNALTGGPDLSSANPANPDTTTFTSDINGDPSQSGVIDWGMLGLVGLGLLAMWWMFSD
jgi:hypothetical protein